MNPTLVSRRRFAAALAATSAAAAWPNLASAQNDKPLQMIVGYPPGGSTDAFARLISVPLQGALGGRSVVVRNQAGAGGQIAASALLREGADGSAVLAINQPDLNLAVARGNAGFKLSDFRVIMADLHEPRVFLVRNDGAIDSFGKFVSEARANPGKLSISVAGGSAQETLAQWLVDQLRIDVLIVNYKGGSEAVNALLAGDVTANLGDDFVRSAMRSKTTALFIGSDKKSPRWPEAPTLQSLLSGYGVGMPSPHFLARYGVYVVSAAFAQKNPKGYQELQQAMLTARSGSVFTEYIQKNGLADMSIGAAGEPYESVFAADMKEIEKLKR
ncbi:tripartite tricarboxylate transporter substrate-binding protein [Xylophilus sp. GOD-11R]|uniref:tripartite tricarboxylate transporter substrate-binding protein n=1 Tax=Xylophilus sp. GOD-11R TaxID=3089814 RepID=UPI00298C970C|nr:tripartite tricarboxylate transporter substrate-binding protein [Xylophilus sp. GOD-11R]WPB58251.1 tripartite tricarboxylate transporter substrate-binding protein [Xylophilus sp. GOD-11R]